MVRLRAALTAPLAACALLLSATAPAHAAEGTLTWDMYRLTDTDPSGDADFKEEEYQVTMEDPAPGCHTIPEDARYKRVHTEELFMLQEVYRFQNDTEQPVMLIDAPCDPSNEHNLPSGSFQLLDIVSPGNSAGNWPENARSILIG
ncbi:hypothetical protein [Streptomyces lancefieldiae]|uniref:Uncharacterized protein n=1 Tax=Streptomyces lancefieldiae TaxID=3075520 RepID=A0ABU3B1S4_9ACTN|nr:hypothetical protein [Streptomyces sp. DSM 40712]MDT0616113.1 hypothetical protein [Streptomyces sp. DSM 40712]